MGGHQHSNGTAFTMVRAVLSWTPLGRKSKCQRLIATTFGCCCLQDTQLDRKHPQWCEVRARLFFNLFRNDLIASFSQCTMCKLNWGRLWTLLLCINYIQCEFHICESCCSCLLITVAQYVSFHSF